MEPINIALLGSVTINAVLLWAWKEARYNAVHYRKLFDYWKSRADYWRILFDDLRRNSVLRDPKTGRYVKGYRTWN